MTVNASLISQIPVTSATQQPSVNMPAVASVKVGDVVETHNGVVYEEPKGLVEKFKAWLVEYRMKKLEEKSPEKRTPSEQAEYEANQKSLNLQV